MLSTQHSKHKFKAAALENGLKVLQNISAGINEEEYRFHSYLTGLEIYMEVIGLVPAAPSPWYILNSKPTMDSTLILMEQIFIIVEELKVSHSRT